MQPNWSSSDLRPTVGTTNRTLWPVLVADLADADSRDFLEGVALAGGRAYIPLLSAPAVNKRHRLEVFTPGSCEPLMLFAVPLGPPTAVGFPLRLCPFDPNATPKANIAGLGPRSDGRDPGQVLRSRVTTETALSANHTRELSGVSADPEALVGLTLAAGKLRIDRLIGTGGAGLVYEAFHRDLRITVAIKALHREFQNDIEFCRRFHAEALATSRLDHPNLMRVFDFGQEPDGMLYLAMEHVKGRPLSALAEPDRPMALHRIVGLMTQVCAGLGHAHSRGIIHRDIKPENVIVFAGPDDDGKDVEYAKVCDFGIAVNSAERPDAISGTPDYMSPEQYRGSALDCRSDIYSCGVVMYELGTGRIPFPGDNLNDIMRGHIERQPVPPQQLNPAIDPRLASVILKALSKSPDERQASMRDLRSELRAILEPDAPTSTGAFHAQEPTTDPVARPATSSNEMPSWLVPAGASGAPEPAEITATELTASPAAWLARLAETTQRDVFESLAHRLDASMPVLTASGSYKELFAVRCTIDHIADDIQAPPWRSGAAQALRLALADPGLLAELAAAVLAEDSPPYEVAELLHRAGTPGAYALYSARIKASNAAARRRFVAHVRSFGIAALPMIRAALARLESRRNSAIAADLFLDITAASPRVQDDDAGTIVARYLEGSSEPVTCAAIEALVSFWRATASSISFFSCASRFSFSPGPSMPS